MVRAIIRSLLLACLVGYTFAHGGTDHDPVNCLCTCPDERQEAFLLEEGVECTANTCGAVSSCPTRNDGSEAEIKAEKVDCKCHCCEDEGCLDNGEYAYFDTNSNPSECTEEVCKAKTVCEALPFIEVTYDDGTAHSSGSGSSSSSGLSGGAVAGIVIGVIAGVALIAVAGFMLIPRKKRSESSSWTNMHDEMHEQPNQWKEHQPSHTQVSMGDYLQ
mmetsp:Transcript_11096/g.68306  ORF Transcript_11096/g.68306 Transcript_11096/m.68306 type:complete len:217 (-) Transcript_11096:4341-4991(-)|eukprot:CAMPEP_0183831106 /NCGR_PEP_ID=MMETSP0807_2-20130328/4416_1 /TAXON_ID=88271 /ORGANISM="Picocystis salinarum, Strain CCMP1897" /LENGTH=216 /DNA_ID=CAMNT_0026076515 /DNA_START=298 /DNA_END=948 /DNA_ORIENTATION=-